MARKQQVLKFHGFKVSRSKNQTLDWPPNFFGNCAVGARWSGLAQRGGSLGPRSAGPTDDRRLGIRCHDGRKKHLPVRLNLPSGLLYESPGGEYPTRANRGKSPLTSICFSIHYGGMASVKGKTRSHLNSESRPGVYGRCPLAWRSAKSALGCLTYSRIWCLSRGKHNIW